MKPYQFYQIGRFPNISVGQSVSNHIQLTFYGEGEDVKTEVMLEREGYEGSLALLRIQSSIRHQTIGFIKRVTGHERETINFNEYLQPVDFEAYHDHERNLVIFQAPKKTCRGVLAHLRENPMGIELQEMEVDFAQVMERHEEYIGAWFRGVSSHIQAAGLSGNQIQDDTLFQSLEQIASLSNVTIPWRFEGIDHRVMVTSRGGVVLVNNYQDNI